MEEKLVSKINEELYQRHSPHFNCFLLIISTLVIRERIQRDIDGEQVTHDLP